MSTILTSLDDVTSERINKLADQCGVSRSELSSLALEFILLDENQDDFRKFIFSRFDEEPIKETEELDPTEDLNMGIGADTYDDLPGSDPSDEDLAFVKDQNAEESFEDLLEEIDQLGDSDEE